MAMYESVYCMYVCFWNLIELLTLLYQLFQSFLPAILNESFSPYIAVSLPVIVAGLSDDNDGVREVGVHWFNSMPFILHYFFF